MHTNQDKIVVVIGAGIAGATTAIGLKKLGFNVAVIYRNRPFTAYEGFSEKTKNGLLMMGCENASKLLVTQSIRNSNWANQKASVNYEYVVNRDELDKALLEDLKQNSIKTINGKVTNIDYTNNPTIEYKKDSSNHRIECDFVVDARGRFTPYKKEYICGAKSFSLLQELELEDFSEAKTSIDSIKDGWVWQAYVGENKGYLQFSCDEHIANEINNFEDILKYLKEQELDLWSLKDYKIKGKLVKRDSYSKLHNTIVNKKMILIGDAASSIDPLSGNGAFQAMSMSSISPYVINTILNTKDSEIAIEFYKQRVEFIFKKFAKVAKEFYSMEKRFESEFWDKRQNCRLGEYKITDTAYIKQSAIVKDGFIHPREVVVTKDNPLGVYFLGDIEIVELVKYCLTNTKEKSLEYIEKFNQNINEKNRELIKEWLLKQELI